MYIQKSEIMKQCKRPNILSSQELNSTASRMADHTPLVNVQSLNSGTAGIGLEGWAQGKNCCQAVKEKWQFCETCGQRAHMSMHIFFQRISQIFYFLLKPLLPFMELRMPLFLRLYECGSILSDNIKETKVL